MKIRGISQIFQPAATPVPSEDKDDDGGGIIPQIPPFIAFTNVANNFILNNSFASIQFPNSVTFPGAGSISKNAAVGLFISALTGSVFDFALTDSTGNSGILVTPTGTVNVGMNGLLYLYKGINTAGMGVPPIYAATHLTGQTGSVTVASYTPANNGDFLICANFNVSTASGGPSVSMSVTYTNELGTSTTTLIVSIGLVSAGSTAAGTPIYIRAKAGTTISVTLSITGTATVNASGAITQVA